MHGRCFGETWVTLGGALEVPWGALGGPWGCLGGILGCLVGITAVLGMPRGGLGVPWRRLEGPLGYSGGPLGCFVRSLECLGVALGSHLAALGRSWGGLWCLGFDAGVLWVSERSARASEASEARGATWRSQRGETVDKQKKIGKHLTSNFVFLVLSGPSALLRFTGLGWSVGCCASLKNL